MLNLSPLFFQSDDEKTAFLDEIELHPIQRASIAQAKTDVRNCLRDGIPKYLKARELPSTGAPEPRFFTQGSWAYKTLNAPSRKPQQADIDDGAYLPLSFVTLASKRPSTASSIYFMAAEAALQPLVEERGWTLHTDKPTCIRIEISSSAHIDVPLYAIPDDEFTTLTKAALSHGFETLSEGVMFAERDAWTKLPRDAVLLAHREKNWIESDPRPVKEWFLGEVEARGEQLRRVVRYLKAYRDWQWESGGPASILLMAAASPNFERRLARDDLALLDVVTKLPGALRKGVCNPVEPGESLTKRLGPEGVEDAAKKFESFENSLRGAIDCSSPSQACIWMRQEFGPRFPDRPESIKQVSVAATISATPAIAGASEIVGRTKAG
jgi:hypothetical protein